MFFSELDEACFLVKVTILFAIFWKNISWPDIYVTETMVEVNRTTSAPNSVLRYVVDKGQIFAPEFNIYLSLISQMKVRDQS